MKKKVTRILKILIATIICIAVIIFVLVKFFSDNIEKSVISMLQDKLEAPLIIGDVEFTIYDNFPSASVRISNLLIKESKGFDNDTLLFAKRAYVEIKLTDIINNHYNLENIIITDGNINIKYNSSNIPNFLILKEENNNKSSLEIKKISLLNSRVIVKKETSKLNVDWLLKKSIISINQQKYALTGEGFSNKLFVDSINYMDGKNFNIASKIDIKKDTIKVLESKFNIQNVLFDIKGNIANSNNIDLKINVNKQDINKIITHLPKKLKDITSEFTVAGKITLNGSIKGIIDKENNPFLDMRYLINGGAIKFKNNTFELSDIQMKGVLNNGDSKNLNSTQIKTDIFKAQTRNGDIDGKFILQNMNSYFLDAEFKSSWDLSEVNQYFDKSNFMKLKGKIFTNTIYQGNIAADSQFKKMFLNAYHKSDIKLENVEFFYKEFPLKFIFKSADGKIKNDQIAIRSTQATISETDINFNGEIKNLISYIFDNSDKIYVNGHTASIYANFIELMTLSDISGEDKEEDDEIIMPDWISVSTSVDIKNFSYEKFIASDLTAKIKYNNGIIKCSDIKASSLNGGIRGEFTLDEYLENNLKLLADIDLEKINIRNSFDAFNNYNQTFIVREQLKGVGSANLRIESYWMPDFILDKKKLKIQSHLTIEKGELIDFKPLESLSSYISLDELKHVKFSTLENTINVMNEVITIPTMEIKSSALSVFLSGTHTFGQEIDYDITLLLSELLSKTLKKENASITEFGEEKKDGKIFNTVYFKMTGDTDNPKISLNKIRFMEDLQQTIKKEQAIINNIINADILKKEEKIKTEDENIEIEWNPEL